MDGFFAGVGLYRILFVPTLLPTINTAGVAEEQPLLGWDYLLLQNPAVSVLVVCEVPTRFQG